MIGANQHRGHTSFGFRCLDGQRTDVLLEVLEADGLADHAIHANVSVERSGFRTDIGGDGNYVCIAIGCKDTVFASSDATGALNTVEIGHLDIHENEVENLGTEQLKRLESAVKADGRTC